MNKSPLDQDLQSLKIVNEPSTSEIIVKEMLSSKNLKRKTDLSEDLAISLTRGEVFYKLTGSKLMRSLIDNIAEYRISLKRKGREENVKMVQATTNNFIMDDGAESVKRKILP